MISGNKKLRIIRCNESELTGENSKYPVTEGYVYICEDTENVYFDDSNSKRHLVNGKLLDGSTTFIINELVKQNIEYKNLLNSINATQSLVSPQNEEQKIKFDSVSDLLNNSTTLDYSSNNFSEIPCITIKTVNVREDWAKPYYRYTTIEDASKTSAKLVFKFDESIANENNRGPINIDVEYTLSDSQTTTDIYSPGSGISIDKNNKSISLSDSGVSANTYGPSANVTGTNNSTILIPKITVDRYGRVTNVANITYTSKDTVYTHPTHTSHGNGLYKITVDGLGHVSSASDVQKSDITGLGIPAQDTIYTHPGAGHSGYGSGLYNISVNGTGHVTGASAVNGQNIRNLSPYKSGPGISVSSGDGSIAISGTFYNYDGLNIVPTNGLNDDSATILTTFQGVGSTDYLYAQIFYIYENSKSLNSSTIYLPTNSEGYCKLEASNLGNVAAGTASNPSLSHCEVNLIFKRNGNNIDLYNYGFVYWYWNGSATSASTNTNSNNKHITIKRIVFRKMW